MSSFILDHNPHFPRPDNWDDLCDLCQINFVVMKGLEAGVVTVLYALLQDGMGVAYHFPGNAEVKKRVGKIDGFVTMTCLCDNGADISRQQRQLLES